MWSSNYGYPMMDYQGYVLLHAIFSLVWFFILIGVIMMAVRLFRGNKSGWRHFHGENSALTILKERYAKGEIERDEFEQKKKDLS